VSLAAVPGRSSNSRLCAVILIRTRTRWGRPSIFWTAGSSTSMSAIDINPMFEAGPGQSPCCPARKITQFDFVGNFAHVQGAGLAAVRSIRCEKTPLLLHVLAGFEAESNVNMAANTLGPRVGG